LGSSGKWQVPKTIGKPINTSYYEDGACLSPDGNTLYFVSERPEGFGRGDIYMSKKISSSEWSNPINLGPTVNTEEDEGGIFIAPDGKTLFFCSEGHNSMGSYDIFKTVFENGKWTTPVNVGYPINTLSSEKSFILSTDGKTAYVSSDRKGGIGERDIYRVDMNNYAILEKDGKFKPNSGLSILKGSIFNSDGQGTEALIEIVDESGQKAGTTSSNTDGNYFITLPGDKKYTLKLNIKGFDPISETVQLPFNKDKTYSLAKDFILHKANLSAH